MGMRVFGGHSFADSLTAGAYAVVRGQAVLDRINVFPVADADTGANLAATLTAAASGLGRTPPAGIDVASRIAADGALRGARGNSGAIFAQFLHGLAEGLHSKHDVGPRDFALAATAGADSAYLAVKDPREGTILSVLRAWARELATHADHAPDFHEFLVRALSAARTALGATPSQLDVLARNRVVDAGGQGFVYFLEGMLVPLQPGGHKEGQTPLTAFPVVSQAEPAGFDERVRVEVDERFRYCAEALVHGRSLEREAVQRAVGHLGESLVVAGGGSYMRVHLHTNQPDAFRAALETLAEVKSFKLDDMVAQQQAVRAATIALVTDSTADLAEAARLRSGMVMVPLTVSLAGRAYKDRVELDPAGFYRLVRQTGELPRTSQPNRTEFRRLYEVLLADHDAVVSVHLSPRMSGTIHSARGAAEDVDPSRVRVVDARHLSVGLGLVVEAAGEAIRTGGSLDEVVAAAEEAAGNTRVYGATPSLDFAVKGGRVSSKVAALAGLIELHPVILFDEEGAAHTDGAHLGFNRALRGLARRSVEFAAGSEARFAIAHADNPAGVAYVLQRLRGYMGFDQDIPIMESGAVLATHTGLGAIAVAVRRDARPRSEGGG